MRNMKVQITRKSELVISTWSGGTTTQLAIYPEGASYADRNFLFRISTATVETDESTFTHLPGISRKIMILEGVLRLEHTGRHTKTLHKFETDSFEGDWETKGFGKVRDFNLMTRGGVQGEVFGTCLKKDETVKFQSKLVREYIGLYLLQGCLEISSVELTSVVNEGDFILLEFFNSVKQLTIYSMEVSEIAITRIPLP